MWMYRYTYNIKLSRYSDIKKYVDNIDMSQYSIHFHNMDMHVDEDIGVNIDIDLDMGIDKDMDLDMGIDIDINVEMDMDLGTSKIQYMYIDTQIERKV